MTSTIRPPASKGQELGGLTVFGTLAAFVGAKAGAVFPGSEELVTGFLTGLCALGLSMLRDKMAKV